MDNPADSTDARLTRYVTDPALEAWLNAAWRQLQLDAPGLVAAIYAGTVEAAAAGDVVIAATLRVLRNPEGAQRTGYGIDDYREDVQHADATQDIYFTAAELRRLQPDTATAGEWSGSVKYS